MAAHIPWGSMTGGVSSTQAKKAVLLLPLPFDSDLSGFVCSLHPIPVWLWCSSHLPSPLRILLRVFPSP